MLSSAYPFAIGVALFIPLALRAWFKHQRIARSFGLPTLTVFLDSQNIWTGILPRIPGIVLGREWYWKPGHRLFAEAGSDVLVVLGFFPLIRASLSVADAAVIKEITTARSKFPKPLYPTLKIFGSNVLVAEGHEWKRHRKIVAPAFSEKANKLVWNESVTIVHGLFEIWKGKPEIVIEHANDITMTITLMIISVAGFGNRLTWNDDVELPEGHTMTFKQALLTVATRVITQLLVPGWAKGLTADWRNVRTAFSELEGYMREMIQARRVSGSNQDRSDLLSSLLEANEMEEEGQGLTDEEVMGNIFIFLIAGHETSSHSLCFAMAYLALFPDIQQQVYEHIITNVSDISNPAYSDMAKLPLVLAVIYETIRLIPPAAGSPKFAAEHTTLRFGRPDGSTIILNVPKDTPININMSGIHRNPRYWKNPDKFDPSRFLGEWDRDAFIPFAAGPRACLGRKFSETESVAILAMILAQFKIEIKPEAQFSGESFEQRQERVLHTVPGITLTPVRVPLVFRRRS